MSGGLRSGSVLNFKSFFECLAGCVLAARRAAGARARDVISLCAEEYILGRCPRWDSLRLQMQVLMPSVRAL